VFFFLTTNQYQQQLQKPSAEQPCSLELISQNQSAIQQCFSLITIQHQQQA
jgi:hypothetical protein